MFDKFCVGKPLYLAIGLIFLVLGVAATAFRTVKKYHEPTSDHNTAMEGMCDYHNGMYFPARAVLKGISPYGQDYADANPVARQIPFFSPSILVLHAPVVLLPIHVGEVIFFTISVACVIGIGLLLSAAVGEPRRLDFAIGIAAVLVFSRAGHITLYDGYFTFEIVLATFLAIHWGDRRPWLAALALAIVASKPTYILPLGFLLLMRGNVKAIVLGAVISILTTIVPMLWIAWNEGEGDMRAGVNILLEDIAATQDLHRAQEDESPVNSWTRIDLLAIIAKWTRDDPNDATHLMVMAGVLLPALLVLHLRRRRNLDDGLVGITGAIILTATVVSIYHQSYDALLLAAPLAGLAGYRMNLWADQPRWLQVFVAALILIPLYSYFSTRMVLERLGVDHMDARVATSVNGVCLAVLLVIFLWLGWGQKSSLKSA
jgi:Glycosyltransferase family 87